MKITDLLQVRFYEVEYVWNGLHGHYVGWFEMGRNDLTQRFQMGPLQLKEINLLAPVRGIKMPV